MKLAMKLLPELILFLARLKTLKSYFLKRLLASEYLELPIEVDLRLVS